MAYYKNPITRYLLRKNILGRIKYRINSYIRLLTKDALDDIAFLLKDKQVEIILDVGATIGFMTYQFQRRFPKAVIHAFEPNPSVFSKLQENYFNQRSIHLYPLGVGEKNSELLFNINAKNGTSSFLMPTQYHQLHHAGKLLDPILVSVVCLDDFCKENHIERIDILKLDIEGFELNALKGARELLADQKIDIIYSEVNFLSTYEKQPLFHELTAYLEKMDYYLFNIDNFSGGSPIRQAVQSNATYISRTFRSYLESHFGKHNCGW